MTSPLSATEQIQALQKCLSPKQLAVIADLLQEAAIDASVECPETEHHAILEDVYYLFNAAFEATEASDY